MKHLLKEYEDMKREKSDLQIRINELEQQLNKYDASYQVCDTVSGGTGGIQHFAIKGFPYPEYARKRTNLLQRKMQMKRLSDDLEDMILDVEDYINSVQRSRMRQILRYRYIDGLSWKAISKRIGGKCSPDSIRKEHDRFIRVEK